jgi:hypothetical protein
MLTKIRSVWSVVEWLMWIRSRREAVMWWRYLSVQALEVQHNCYETILLKQPGSELTRTSFYQVDSCILWSYPKEWDIVFESDGSWNSPWCPCRVLYCGTAPHCILPCIKADNLFLLLWGGDALTATHLYILRWLGTKVVIFLVYIHTHNE